MAQPFLTLARNDGSSTVVTPQLTGIAAVSDGVAAAPKISYNLANGTSVEVTMVVGKVTRQSDAVQITVPISAVDQTTHTLTNLAKITTGSTSAQMTMLLPGEKPLPQQT